jgi:hypothetical protein
MGKPDWGLWLYAPSVTLEECVCLSMDAEPSELPPPAPVPQAESPAPMRSANGELWAAPIVVGRGHPPSRQELNETLAHVHPALLSSEGKEKLAQLRKHFAAGHVLLPPVGVSDYYGVYAEKRVTLHNFARWAHIQGWKVPPQLEVSPAPAAPAQHDSALREALAEAESARAVLEAQLASMKTTRATAPQELQPAHQQAHASAEQLQQPVEPEMPAVAAAISRSAAKASTETAEERENRRLKMCEAAGIVMPMTDPSVQGFRLPRGVGRVAKQEGVTRQTFTEDVKAALQRRYDARRAGQLFPRPQGY